MTAQQPEKKAPDSKEAIPSTGRLNAEQRRSVTIPTLGSFGTRFLPDNLVYHPVPYNYRTVKNPIRWRVLFKFNDPAPRVTFGLDIYDDIVLGRGTEGTNPPDVDLSNLDAIKLGVSRRHSLIRPARNCLFLIDLESTNGSYVNAIPVGRGMAQRVAMGDVVALAGLSFQVEVVLGPAGYKKPTTGELIKKAEETKKRVTTLSVDNKK